MIGAIDATLDKLNSKLPRRMDAYSDLVRVRREKLKIVYSVRVFSKSIAEEMRNFSTNDPKAFASIGKSLIKQSACEPEPNIFLKEGFTVVWEMLDGRGRLSRSTLTLADCR